MVKTVIDQIQKPEVCMVIEKNHNVFKLKI